MLDEEVVVVGEAVKEDEDSVFARDVDESALGSEDVEEVCICEEVDEACG